MFSMSMLLLPGFALMPAMYSRLDLGNQTHGIDIVPQSNFETTSAHIMDQCPDGSIVIGYSLGARLALFGALTHPEKVAGLILISVHAGIENDDERQQRIVSDRDEAKQISKDVDLFFHNFDKKTVFDQLDNEKQELINSYRIADPEMIEKQLTTLGQGVSPDMSDRLGQLRMPVLYITGSRDEKYSDLAAIYKKKTPFSHHKIIDADHRVPLIAPEITSRYIKWFADHVVNAGMV
jgi:2-succinyl-6-hydroxy-2,4-cyclohexadiene-1-carboxylate synthase